MGTRLTPDAETVEAGQTCSSCPTPEQSENRGMAWVIGAFLICPCHLPLTLWLAATLLSGTVAGAVLHDHLYLAGAVISVTWLAATWHGLRVIRSAQRMR